MRKEFPDNKKVEKERRLIKKRVIEQVEKAVERFQA